jgi:Ca2+-binding RTX toxin-like protein
MAFPTLSFPSMGSSQKTYNGTSSSESITGSSLNETFYSNGGSDTLTGGAGSDRYFTDERSKVVESADGGTDKITATSNYVLPANVENLEVWGAYGAIGNSLNNVITGNAQTNTINGLGGNDQLRGGGGSDYFAFDKGSGYDIITDFTAGSGSGSDMIRLGGYSQFQSLANVKAAMTQEGSDVVLTLSPTDAIKIQNTSISQFTADNFQLSFDPSKLKMTFSDDFNSLNLWNPTTKTGIWRTDYGYGSTTDSLGSRTLPSNNEQQIYTDPYFKGT